jgi:hypothetical protein
VVPACVRPTESYGNEPNPVANRGFHPCFEQHAVPRAKVHTRIESQLFRRHPYCCIVWPNGIVVAAFVIIVGEKGHLLAHVRYFLLSGRVHVRGCIRHQRGRQIRKDFHALVVVGVVIIVAVQTAISNGLPSQRQ